MEKEINNSPNNSNNNLPIKLDNKDKEILRLLNEDARLTSKYIGNLINSSREVTDYRIKRLIKTGLIKNFITIINDRLLGYDSYLLLLKLQNYTKEDEQRIISFLKEHPYTKWVLKSGGEWDIQTVVIAEDKKDLAKVIEEIDCFCGKNLLKYDFCLIVNLLVPENLSYLLVKHKPALPSPEIKPTKKISIDKKDSLLLKALATKAREPVIKIAQQIGLSADATHRRIKKLKNLGVIKKFQAVVDQSKLNYLLYSVFLKVSNYSQEKESALRTFFYSLPHITFAERILGPWDIRLQISCATPQELDQLLQKIREFLGTDLKYFDFALMLKEYKRVSYPQGMEK